MQQDIYSLTSNALERLIVPRPVDRIAFIKQRCRGHRVLDLGAYDETEVAKKQHSSWRWLHAEIARVAREVLGVDASEKLRRVGRMETAAGTTIIYGEVEQLHEIALSFMPDLVVAGELIEHTPDPLGWLRGLGKVLPGVNILLSTPNATSLINIGLAFANRENAHVDHLHVYSFKTLAALARNLRLRNPLITPYYYHSHLFRAKVPKWVRPLVYAVDYLCLTPVQFLFPLTAGGLILEGMLGEASDERSQLVRALDQGVTRL